MVLVKHFRELRVYQDAFEVAMQIFELTKKWPTEEKYSLIDQIRRSSRSVCGAIAEGWKKRRYQKHFISKMTDADSEMAETQSWIEFSMRCGYLGRDKFEELDGRCEHVSRGLAAMIGNANRWCGPSSVKEE